MIKSLVFLIHLIKSSVKASINHKGSFLLTFLLILLNNLVFLALWWIFFQRFEKIGTWELKDMTALIAVSSGAFGLMQIAFGGIQKIPQLIASGELDTFITKPQNTLLHIACSKSSAKGWAHLTTGLLLTIFGGFVSFFMIPLVILCMILGCFIFSSMTTIVYTLPFWFAPIERVSNKYYEMLLLFSMHPTHIYQGIFKVILFSILPAGLIGTIPIELFRLFSLEKLIFFAGISGIFVTLAFIIFNLGLKRYESSNQFTLQR